MSDDPHGRPPGPGGIPVGGAGVGTASRLVRRTDLTAMRRLLRDSTARAGLSTDVAQQFTLAVNEIVINAIRHAGGVATVSVAVTEPGDDHDGRIAVTVSDTGPGLAPHVRPELPPADHTNGRGLWLAHRMCDDIEIESSPGGTVVRLRATASNPC